MSSRYIVKRCPANSQDLKDALKECPGDYELHSVVPYLRSQHESMFMVIFQPLKFGYNTD